MVQAGPDLPQYQCHKKVRALKLRGLLTNFDKDDNPISYLLVPEDSIFSPIACTEQWLAKHKPEPGGYYVVYEDGYTSFSPAEAFESGYTLIDHME
jgi:hypothetical protein